MKTEQEFEEQIEVCHNIFQKKLKDYGASWRILRSTSVTDQILIRAKRIRSLEMKQTSLVGEGIVPEYIAIVNYGIVGLIQLKLKEADQVDMEYDQAMSLYDQFMTEAKELMLKKNHDYDEAWRVMRVTSYTDLILTKIYRTKQIEENGGKTIISEGIDANYMDMINYAIFALIKLNKKS